MNKQEKELVDQALTRFKATLENLECECTENHKCTIHNDLILVDNALAGLSFSKEKKAEEIAKYLTDLESCGDIHLVNPRLTWKSIIDFVFASQTIYKD